jgi:hypothetical protein
METRKLVPIETVALTESCSFRKARQTARRTLLVESEFEGMVDIALAREQQVTPLPILGEQS